MDCKNFEGSEEGRALYHGEHDNVMAFIQQATNAPINGAVGSCGFGTPPAIKKRKVQHLVIGEACNDLLYNECAQSQVRSGILCNCFLD